MALIFFFLSSFFDIKPGSVMRDWHQIWMGKCLSASGCQTHTHTNFTSESGSSSSSSCCCYCIQIVSLLYARIISSSSSPGSLSLLHIQTDSGVSLLFIHWYDWLNNWLIQMVTSVVVFVVLKCQTIADTATLWTTTTITNRFCWNKHSLMSDQIVN